MEKCRIKWFGNYIHNWGLWEMADRGNILRRDDESKVGVFILQERKCKDCGFTELSKQVEGTIY